MKISIFGLGYVGCVSLGCLAKNGHEVIGVDINETKVDLINKGIPTIVEKDIDKIINEQHKLKRISATTDFKKAILSTDVSIICVGTPSTKEGHLNLDYIYKTAQQIGEALQGKDTFYTVVIRSTVLPGTNSKVGDLIEKVSKKKRNKDFAVVSNPEFLREGSAVEDYYNPPVTVIGSDNKIAIKIMSDIYSKINGPIELVDIKVAEMIKYVNNSFHALKISFANEVGNICKKNNIDSFKVMDLFKMDKQLNISSYYFTPGFAYGGSCLPKDLKALETLAHDSYIDAPVLSSIAKSNERQKNITYDLIVSQNKKRIGILGVSFKAGTDDLRYSPIIDVVEKLIGKGFDLKLFDENINLQKLVGQNKSFVKEKLPHIDLLLYKNIEDVITNSDIIVIAHKEKLFENISIDESKIIIDLVRIAKFEKQNNYYGLCW